MVEIALSLAVVAFALVAIMGVLPTGMTVEKDNREDTLMNQEGRYWLEAIKSGTKGLDEITNFVEYIKIERSGQPNPLEFKNDSSTPFQAADIITLLSTPKYLGPITNRVTARLRPITGNASERSSLTNDISFRYQMQVEIVPSFPIPGVLAGQALAAGDPRPAQFNEAMGANLWDVRLILRWPVVEKGKDYQVGNGRKTFRARISARPEAVPLIELSSFVKSATTNLVVLRPNQFNVQAGFAAP